LVGAGFANPSSGPSTDAGVSRYRRSRRRLCLDRNDRAGRRRFLNGVALAPLVASGDVTSASRRLAPAVAPFIATCSSAGFGFGTLGIGALNRRQVVEGIVPARVYE
jgi:hypothetical protein